jgi:signal transduction histidine kinase
VTTVLDDARTLSRLVDDLRTLAHSESGTLALTTEPVDLGVLIAETATAFQPQAQSRGVTLTTAVPAVLPSLHLDPVRIREVLINLLENAVRYAPTGSIIGIEAERTSRDVRIRVSDQGPGISAEALPHIFDRFFKGTGSRGSGLGLTIARNLIAAHGGTIEARARPEGGTIVEFSLPATDD